MGIITKNNKIITSGGKIVFAGLAKLFSYNAGSQTDVFLDNTYVDSLSGVVFNVNIPTKYGSNPIFETGTNNATWDYDKEYHTILKIGDTYYMWYGAQSVAPYTLFICRATSADGITWVKPNLGLVSYGGNTNNNIILGAGAYGSAVVYDIDGASDRKYVSVNEQRVGDITGGSVYIYKSADGISFTLIKTLTRGDAQYIEGKEIIKKPDGKWIAYYCTGQLVNFRKIGAWTSDTTDLEGTWTDNGVIINSSSILDQKYCITVEFLNGIYYGFVGNYNSITQQMIIDLYISRDGLSWTIKKSNWIPLGLSASWENEMVFPGGSLVKNNNTWFFYYGGCSAKHDVSVNQDVRLGYATIGYERIGSVDGKGYVITKAFTPTSILTINADITYGSLQVELLKSSDNTVITGYSKDDMDKITGNTYLTEVKWKGNSIPTDQELKIKFYLN
jgi:hypothetical protein